MINRLILMNENFSGNYSFYRMFFRIRFNKEFFGNVHVMEEHFFGIGN